MKKNYSKLIFFIGTILLILGLVFYFKNDLSTNQKQNPGENRMIISASFYPLANLATQIGGEKVEVITITPAGAEPHDYEPTPQDIVKIESSQILILNGNGIDPWGEKLKQTLLKKNIFVLKMSDFIVGNDPHFWLDPLLYAKMAETVSNALVKTDKNNEQYFQNNLKSYNEKLNKLNNDYENGLKSCQIKEIVVSHNAFSYLAKRYHFASLYISGLSPNEEPSPKRIAQIATLAKEKQIKYIFFETLVSSKIADTIAREIGAETLVLNPLEGLTKSEIKSGKNYIRIMKDNLSNLRKAMICQ